MDTGPIDDDNIADLVQEYVNDNPNKLKPIGKWDVSKVTNMHALFYAQTGFNEDLNEWDVSNVKNMASMFKGCVSFNQPLDKWNVSNVTNMVNMFSGCVTFNQPLIDWDVSKVADMRNMFASAIAMDDINKPSVEKYHAYVLGTLALSQYRKNPYDAKIYKVKTTLNRDTLTPILESYGLPSEVARELALYCEKKAVENDEKLGPIYAQQTKSSLPKPPEKSQTLPPPLPPGSSPADASGGRTRRRIRNNKRKIRYSKRR